MPQPPFTRPAMPSRFLMPLLFAAAAALPCTSVLAAPATAEDSAQGEALSPPASPKEGKGANSSAWL
ncbi:nucleoside-specific channel-forming protein Tsx, partial [Pseudomonas syringae]|nr:nucleoside-specific channel-forming protein Tsx [Pseudomonas syringae]